ncbi:hypothetical protein K505DRAFT_321001 [Melanomma pulvis-pyrius CBS 109.77]|uniref:Uncharacterized protein n=1 Tax=Melanomma pulvis-pyrius CBS 109.77 TaxID=1314802 RepID=A0A6A6XSX9_9PLEO|nr:hypothetical protein K505DRAFT_321001 [Melanomma pulvis-pyrius CBS 109.77]
MCRHCSAKPKKQVPQTAQPASMSVDRAENDGLHEGNANGEHNRGNENNSVDGNNSVTRRFCPSSLCNVL